MSSVLSKKPIRFYRRADIAMVEDGWAISLDDRVPRSPERNYIILPTKKLAQDIADEWARQEEVIDVQSMHMTRLANVAIDRTPKTRVEMEAEIVKYAETDLVCYLADKPQDLRNLQEENWKPIRDWAQTALDIELKATEGIFAVTQPPGSLETAKSYVGLLDDYRLTGVSFGVGVLGSLLLSLGMETGHLSGDEAFRLNRIDDDWQAKQWGEDSESKRFAAEKLDQCRALERWFAAL